MQKLKLTYFDMHAGRGEPSRIALYIAGVEFEDNRIKFADWPALKPNTPFGSMPLLEVDGQMVCQSNGINRFVGKLTGLYPTDPLQAAFADEAMDVVEEATVPIVATFNIKDDAEKKAKRLELADGLLTFYLTRLAKRLEARGGEWFSDNRLTIADIKVFLWIRHLKSGNLDHLPTDLVDRVAPQLALHWERVKSHPKVAAYYDTRAKA